MKLNLDSPVSQGISALLPPWDRREGGSRKALRGGGTQEKFPASKVPNPPFLGRQEEGNQCLPRDYSGAAGVLGAFFAFTPQPRNNFMKRH